MVQLRAVADHSRSDLSRSGTLPRPADPPARPLPCYSPPPSPSIRASPSPRPSGRRGPQSLHPPLAAPQALAGGSAPSRPPLRPRLAAIRTVSTADPRPRPQIIDDGFVSLTLSHCPLQCFIFTEIFTWKILLQENWECGTGHMFDEMSRKENQRKLGVWHSHQTLICGSSGTYDPSLITFSSYTIQ